MVKKTIYKFENYLKVLNDVKTILEKKKIKLKDLG